MLNHLWQSTVFAGLAWLLTLALKKNRAQVRYWVWMAASAKFLVPFSVLVGMGAQVSWRMGPVIAAQAPKVMEEIARPFEADAPVAPGNLRAAGVGLPELLWLVWAAGFAGILLRWGRRWARMNAEVRKAVSMDFALPVAVKISPSLREPGVFGTFRPVLLLPEGITEKLMPAQMEAILAHEMCHVRRRDNLATAFHMVVESVFWFHPLVWWMGARLIEERERACDEEVLRRGADAQTYAEGILKVCEFYLESPLQCVAGVSGANLKRRIEEIMADRIAARLSAVRKLLLAGAGALAVAGPVASGLMNAPAIRAQKQAPAAAAAQAAAPAGGHYEFAAVSIKPHPPGDRRYSAERFYPGGRFTSNAPVIFVIRSAYGLPANPAGRLVGGPSWISDLESSYDIEATAPAGALPDNLPSEVRDARASEMVQRMLADRFRLVVHRETKEISSYSVLVGSGGPKLQKADIEEKDCPPRPSGGGVDANVFCHAFSGGRGRGLHARAATVADIANAVQNFADLPLVDKTGLSGLYRVQTDPWQPMQFLTTPPPPGTKQDGIDVSDLPTLFTIFDKMGLKLELQKNRMDIVVIDHIERPSAN